MKEKIIKAYTAVAEAAHGPDTLSFFKQAVETLSKTNILLEKESLLNKEPSQFLLSLGLQKLPLGKREVVCEKILAGDYEGIKAVFEGH